MRGPCDSAHHRAFQNKDVSFEAPVQQLLRPCLRHRFYMISPCFNCKHLGCTRKNECTVHTISFKFGMARWAKLKFLRDRNGKSASHRGKIWKFLRCLEGCLRPCQNLKLAVAVESCCSCMMLHGLEFKGIIENHWVLAEGTQRIRDEAGQMCTSVFDIKCRTGTTSRCVAHCFRLTGVLHLSPLLYEVYAHSANTQIRAFNIIQSQNVGLANGIHLLKILLRELCPSRWSLMTCTNSQLTNTEPCLWGLLFDMPPPWGEGGEHDVISPIYREL